MSSEELKKKMLIELRKVGMDVANRSVAAVSSELTDQAATNRVQLLQTNLQVLRAELMLDENNDLLREQVEDAEATLNMALEAEKLVKAQWQREHVKDVLKIAGEVGMQIGMTALRMYLPKVMGV